MRTALVASLVSPIVAAESNGPHAVIVDHGQGGWLVDPDDEDGLVSAVCCARAWIGAQFGGGPWPSWACG